MQSSTARLKFKAFYAVSVRVTLIALVIASGALVTASLAARFLGIQINVSRSMPYYLWRETSRLPIERGSVVSFCPTLDQTQQAANSASWLSKAACPAGVMPVLKPIAAVAGDQVLVRDEGITVNGVFLENSSRHNDSSLRSEIVAEGSYRVETGQVWLVSTFHPSSLDSRYYGPVVINQIGGVFCPMSIKPYAYAC